MPMTSRHSVQHLELPAPLAVQGRGSGGNSLQSTSIARTESPGRSDRSPRDFGYESPNLSDREQPDSRQGYRSPPHRDSSDYLIDDTAERRGILSSPDAEYAALARPISEEPTDIGSPIMDSTSPKPLNQRASVASRYTGVSLRDDGPVATDGALRSVQRTRRVSQNAPKSRASMAGPPVTSPVLPAGRTPSGSLPPGARPA